MNKPIRIQRKRTKGWKKPENTVAVSRGTKYGNPFVVGQKVPQSWIVWFNKADIETYIDGRKTIDTNKEAVALFERYWVWFIEPADIEALCGKNVMCFCGEKDFCHGDILIKLTNKSK